MYSMVLDSVREKNSNNQIMAEVSLMRAALLGNPVILSPNQAIDSLALQEIILANNNDSFHNNYFCKAVELGIVRVAIQENYRDLIDCCLDTFGRGLNDPSLEFIISGLKFLYEKDANNQDIYPYSQRCELTRYIIERLSGGRRSFKRGDLPSWLSSDEKEIVEQYIESIILLDRAVDTYENFTSNKSLFPQILDRLLIERLANDTPDSELSALLTLVHKKCSIPGAPIYRSYYYRLIGSMKKYYSKEALSEVRAVIDIAYNKVMALSVHTGAEISIPNQFNQLTDSVIKSYNPETSFRSSYIAEENISCMNWEMMIWIYQEIHSIMEDKGVDWWSAINILYSRESKLPFILSGKYICCTAIKVAISSFIPGGILISFLQELIDDVVGDIVGEIAPDKMPGSPKETKQRSTQAKKVRKMLDTMVFTGLHKEEDKNSR